MYTGGGFAAISTAFPASGRADPVSPWERKERSRNCDGELPTEPLLSEAGALQSAAHTHYV